MHKETKSFRISCETLHCFADGRVHILHESIGCHLGASTQCNDAALHFCIGPLQLVRRAARTVSLVLHSATMQPHQPPCTHSRALLDVEERPSGDLPASLLLTTPPAAAPKQRPVITKLPQSDGAMLSINRLLTFFFSDGSCARVPACNGRSKQEA